jgi:ribosomal protein S18 acetylase RimI-like enzyme
MHKIKIKKIGLADIRQLQTLGKQTFIETFAEGNTEENMQLYLEEGFTVDKLTLELTDPNSDFYFASIGNKTIGYLKINVGQAQTELKDKKALEIERIYVLKEFYGQQVGQVLFDFAFDLAKQAHADYIWLGVWEQNKRAINFYKKNGFTAFDKHLFKLGNDEQTDIMMKLQLDNLP